MKTFLLLVLSVATLRLTGYAQSDAVYYAGVNPVAPFTGIRSHFAGGTLPAASNLESGIALYVGKIWNRNYNVETRLSYGSPVVNTRQFLVQAGMMYCFDQRGKASLMNSFYAGFFMKLEQLGSTANDPERNGAMVYWVAGKRFAFGKFFADARIGQHLIGLKWGSDKSSKAKWGFHDPVYNWNSPYIPFAGVGIGYVPGR